MDRVISMEDRIRRAEAIYERRRQGEKVTLVDNNDNIEKSKLKTNNKQMKILKKLIVQLIICCGIYFSIQTIYNGNYIFSEDFIGKINEILLYDINFKELFDNVKNQYYGIMNLKKEQQSLNNVGVDGDGEKQEDSNIENKENQDGIGGSNEQGEIYQENIQLSQEEQDIKDVNNMTSFIKPIEGIITSKYGQRPNATGNVPKNHTGLDIAAPNGTRIKSATNGEVVLVSEEGDFGKHIKIQIGEVSVIYAHCSQIFIKQGDLVTQEQEIAEVGSTGNSTGPHLHFEVRISERTVDPESIIQF